MKRRLSNVTILLLSLLFIHNVNSATIKGYIYDRETGQGLGFANVQVLNTNHGAAADEKGGFSIILKPGTYSLRFSMMGYQTHERVVKLSDANSELNIPLIPTVYLMQGVTIIRPSVKAEEESVSNITVQSESVARMPGSLTDIYRSVKTLPGVSSNNGMSSEFNVRGGTFDENLVIVNGAQVYRPFHIKEAPNGSIAIFNMDLLKQVDLITGGFTARYGDKMSSVMNITYREGNSNRFQLQATGSMMHAGLVAEGPSYKGSWILGVRKSYLQYILTALDQDDAVNVDFYDVQGQISCVPAPGRRLAFQFIHSADDYQYGPRHRTRHSNYEVPTYSAETHSIGDYFEKSDYYNNLFALKYVHAIGINMLFNTIVSHYSEYEDENLDNEDQWRHDIWDKQYNLDLFGYSNGWNKESRQLEILTTEFKEEATFKVNAFHELVAGLSYQHLKYDYSFKQDEAYQWGNSYEAYPDTLNFTYENHYSEAIHPATYKISTYLEDNWQLHHQLYANIGMRVDYFDFNRDLDISPRINLSYMTGYGPIIRAAWGYYYQSPSYRELKYTHATSKNTLSQRSIHHILSVEYPIHDAITTKIEGYYKKMDNLISFENRYGNYIYSQSNDTKGYAAGIDCYLNWTYDKMSGWISYSLLTAKEDSLGSQIGYIPRVTDQRHTLSLVTDFDLGKQWELRIKTLYGSGFPHTPTEFVLVDEERNTWEEVVGEKNSDRLPYYLRLDIRIGRIFQWGRVKFEGYLEAINTLNRENVFAYDWNWNDGVWEKDIITLMPFIPNFGFVMTF